MRGDLTVDYPQRRVTVAGRPVALTVIEYGMLVELSVHAGRALTHEHLLQRVWGPDKGEDSGPVRNIVKRLRRKLGDDASNPAHIFAEHRVGYRMEKGQEEPENGVGVAVPPCSLPPRHAILSKVPALGRRTGCPAASRNWTLYRRTSHRKVRN